MKTITVYRDDFKTLSDGSSAFEYILSSLGVAKAVWEDIDHVELSVEDWILQQA